MSYADVHPADGEITCPRCDGSNSARCTRCNGTSVVTLASLKFRPPGRAIESELVAIHA